MGCWFASWWFFHLSLTFLGILWDSWGFLSLDLFKVIWLVVSTHLKNISPKWESSPNRGENKKYLKPPPSNILNAPSYGGLVRIIFSFHFFRGDFQLPAVQVFFEQQEDPSVKCLPQTHSLHLKNDGTEKMIYSLKSGPISVAILQIIGVYVLTNPERSQIHTFKLFSLENLMWSLILFRPSSQHPCDIPLYWLVFGDPFHRLVQSLCNW